MVSFAAKIQVMRSGLLTILGIAALIGNARAQDHAEQAKYELIRETINFLATDKAVSKDTNFRISCETLNYDCFKQQLSTQPIAGIARWYNSWRSMAATDEAGLVALRDQVFADIFERPGKGYRKQLAGYEAYRSRVEGLIRPPVEEMPMEQLAGDTASVPIGHAGSSPVDSVQLTDSNDNPEKEDIMIAYFAIAIGIIALILAALPFFKKKEPQRSADSQRLAGQIYELAERMKRLEQQLSESQVKDAIGSLTEIMESVEKRVVQLENRLERDTE